MEIKLKGSDFTIKSNYKDILKNVFDFNFGSILTDVVKIDSTKESKAFLLLFKTFNTTNLELAKLIGQDQIDNTMDNVLIVQNLQLEVKNFFEQEITITNNFFQDVIKYNPEYLKASYNLFADYMKLLKIDLPYNFEFEYYKSFRKNLGKEFTSEQDLYKILVEYFNNPIIEQNLKFDKLLDHYIQIKNLFTNRLQPDLADSCETLQDLYIEPFFELFKSNLLNPSEDYRDFEFPKKKISIHKFLNEYFLKGKKIKDCKESYSMLFLLGQPGQGKTSFCYKLINDYLNENNSIPQTPIFFIKIRDLVARDFIDNTFTTLSNFLKLETDFDKDEFILVLDGLDEAYMSGGITDRDLSTLYERLNKKTQSNKGLKIILTSRQYYLKTNDPCLDNSLVIKLGEFTDNQILQYTEKFSKFYPDNKFAKKINLLIKDDKYKHIKELIKQAVLIYFIAISDIDINESDSKSMVYDKIFDSLARRSWDKNGQLDYINPIIKNNPDKYAKYLREYIRNIAFEIYQSPNLFITLDHLANLESTNLFIKKCFNNDLSNSAEKLYEISKYLLISFYFQEAKNNPNAETAIEFFHNSLWEFLTAEYLWEELKKLVLRKDDDDYYTSISKENLFNLVDKLIGQKSLNRYVSDNLIQIIQNEDPNIREVVVKQIEDAFKKLSDRDFLLEFSSKQNKLTSSEKTAHISSLCWLFYYHSNFNSDKILSIPFSTNKHIFFNGVGTSSFYREEILRNLHFSEMDSFILIEMLEIKIENVVFNYFTEIKSLMNNKIYNTVFCECTFFSTFMSRNEFHNVSFLDCNFEESTLIQNNKFVNVTFKDSTVSDETWFDQLTKNNSVDELTIQNNRIEERKILHGEDKTISYYVFVNI